MVDKDVSYFFAASNGYSGFVSYFDRIFPPEEFEKIFILKGGPGTGKSRFIKDIITKIKSDDVKCEAALCSADPDSFDGVIVEKENKKIAILDKYFLVLRLIFFCAYDIIFMYTIFT